MSTFDPRNIGIKSEENIDNQSSDSSDSDICYLPPAVSSRKERSETRDEARWDRKPDVSQQTPRRNARQQASTSRNSRSTSREKRREERCRRSETRSSSRERIRGRSYSRSITRSSERVRRYTRSRTRSSSLERKRYRRSNTRSSSLEHSRKRRYSGEEDRNNVSSKSRDDESDEKWKVEDKYKSMENIGDARKVQRKGEKKTFYCPLCMIELNSEDTMNSHVNGVKHAKKSMDYNQNMENQGARGKRLPEMKVYQIPNPEALKKKVPIRLHEKIKASQDPVIGLNHIQEFIAVSDPEMEPYYECEICGSQGHANMIFGHIMGSRHRQMVAEIICKNEIKNGQRKYLNMKHGDLMKFAMKHNENNEKISSRIRTRRSDEEYPWPPGKAPWSIEKGGTGGAPDNARNWSKSSGGKMEAKLIRREDSPEDSPPSKINVKPQAKLPPPNKLKAPQNLEEMKKYLDLGSNMVKMAIDFNDDMGEPMKSKLMGALASMVGRMEEERGKNEESSSNSSRSKTNNNGFY